MYFIKRASLKWKMPLQIHHNERFFRKMKPSKNSSIESTKEISKVLVTLLINSNQQNYFNDRELVRVEILPLVNIKMAKRCCYYSIIR